MSYRCWRRGFLQCSDTKSESHMQWEVIQALLYLEQVFIFSVSVRERCRQRSPQSSYCIPYRSFTNSIKKLSEKSVQSGSCVPRWEMQCLNVTGGILGQKKSACDDQMVGGTGNWYDETKMASKIVPLHSYTKQGKHWSLAIRQSLQCLYYILNT